MVSVYDKTEGELYVKGAFVAMGYYNNPQKTSEAFVQNPLNPHYSEIVYKTGDICKYNDKQELIYLCRKDFQIKHMGYRIELGEIEKCLTAIDGIKSGIALIRKVGKADAICVYYTADRQIEPNEIKSELAKSLTDYMVPSAYVQLDKMPLTPNGKVNTKVLPLSLIHI